jgi:HEAT repeat protein
MAMAELPNEVFEALEADDAEELNALMKRRRPTHFRALQSLLTTDPSVPSHHRTKALHALGRWGDPVVVPAIIDLLPHLDDRERMSALNALGHLGTPEAVTAVIKHAEDASPQVRKMAVLALRRAATPVARDKLRELSTEDPVDWIRDLAAREIH